MDLTGHGIAIVIVGLHFLRPFLGIPCGCAEIIFVKGVREDATSIGAKLGGMWHLLANLLKSYDVSQFSVRYEYVLWARLTKVRR